MSEPTTAASIALYPSAGSGAFAGLTPAAGVGSAVQVLTIAGVSLGLRPDFLIAGMLGAVVSIFLLNSVPLVGDGFGARINNMAQRFGVVLCSAVTSGYLTPLVASTLTVITTVSEAWLLGLAFVVGAGARAFLQRILKHYTDASSSATATKEGA